jgi:hypothetical protein
LSGYKQWLLPLAEPALGLAGLGRRHVQIDSPGLCRGAGAEPGTALRQLKTMVSRPEHAESEAARGASAVTQAFSRGWNRFEIVTQQR